MLAAMYDSRSVAGGAVSKAKASGVDSPNPGSPVRDITDVIVSSLSQDFLPGSWGMYVPTRWDFSTFFGTIGLFLALMFLFVRVLPAIAMFEMKTLTPDAKVKGGGH